MLKQISIKSIENGFVYPPNSVELLEFLKFAKKHLASIERKARSAWARGVFSYVTVLCAEAEINYNINIELGRNFEYQGPIFRNTLELEKFFLNGADNWHQYSWNGCGLVYNYDICCALCTPSEMEKTQYGTRRPNSREDWPDVEARALYQAFDILAGLFRTLAAQKEADCLAWNRVAASCVPAVGSRPCRSLIAKEAA